MKKRRARLVALGVFTNAGRILVSNGADSSSGERFERPLGGGIEFGELAEEALVREIREELEREIVDVRLLGVLENRFTFDGRQRHEVLFVFDARFVDEAIYAQDQIMGVEADGSLIEARWRTLGADDVALYPQGLENLLGVNPE